MLLHRNVEIALRILTRQKISSAVVDFQDLARRTFESQILKGGSVMKYLLLIYQDEQSWSGLTEQERRDIYAEYGKFSEEIKASGHYVGGSELHPASTATSVRVRNGKAITTDGPFAETKEQLGGYYLVEAKNLDEAIGLASRIPSARTGTIEVRPLAEGTASAKA